MSSNEEIVLSDICEAIVDCEHKTAPSQIGGIPLIRTTDIENGKLKLTQAKKISESTYKEWSKRLEPKAEDIILAREAPVGEVGYIPKKQRVCLGQRTVLIRINPKLAYPRYILYLLCSKEVRQKMASLATGSVVSHLNMEDIRVLPLGKLPILEQQRIIGDFLGALDDKIEVNQQMNRTLEAVGEAVFKRWFVDFEFPNQEGKPYKSSGGEMAESAKGVIPKTWEVKNLGDIFDVRWGDTSTTKQSYVDNGFDAYSASGLDGKLDHFDYEGEGIVVSAIGAYCGKTWYANGKWSCIKNTIRILPASKVSIPYLFLLSCRSDIWPKRGSAQPFISQTDARNISIIIPDEIILNLFTELSRKLLIKIIENQKEMILLSNLRDLLLPQLMSGKIRVPVQNKKEKQ